jgi:hypothetical protein
MNKEQKNKAVVRDFLIDGVVSGHIDEQWLAGVLVDAFDNTYRITQLIQAIATRQQDYIEDFYENQDEVYKQTLKLDKASNIMRFNHNKKDG